MVAPSKIFEWPLNRVHCARFLHSLPEQTCTQAFVWNLYRNHMSSAKYYFPVLLFPVLLKWRQLSWNVLLTAIKHYLQITSFAAFINAATFYLMCIFRRVNGRYSCYCTPYLSCWLAAQLSWLMPSRVILFFATGVTQAALEGVLRQLNVSLVYSRAFQTLIYMLCSLVVLSHQQAKQYSGFWFIRPAALYVDYEKWSLAKKVKHGLKELRKYLGIGLTLDLLKGILCGKQTQLKCQSTSFLLSYMGIYKLTQILLIGKLQKRHANLVASFFSGSAFTLMNRFSLMTFVVVIACQVLWQQFCKRDINPKSIHLSRILIKLQAVPFSKLLMPCSLAYLVHCVFFKRHVVSPLAKAFIDSTCDKNAQRVYEILMMPDIESILTKTSQRPTTAFF